MDRRTSVCWKCHETVDSWLDKTCHLCGWIICRSCGSCSAYRCFGEVDVFPSQRFALRRLHFEKAIPGDVNLQEWCINAILESEALAAELEHQRVMAIRAEKALLAEKELAAEKARMDAVEMLRTEHFVGSIVANKAYGNGVITKYGIVDGREFVYVDFPEKSVHFVFPDCFEKGYLT